jgi:YVTN family beta-propeller protein
MMRRSVLSGLALSGLWTVAGCAGGAGPVSPSAPQPSGEATALPKAGRVVSTVPAGAWADAMAVDNGTLWVANYEGDSVSRVDMRTRRVVATVTVGRAPFSMAVKAGQLWVANTRGRSVSRVDIATNREIGRLALAADPDSLGVADNVLWVMGSEGRAYLFSPADGSHKGTVPVSVRSGRCLVHDGAVWLTDFLGGSKTAVRIDPDARRATLTVAVGGMPIAITFGFGSGWVANGADSTVTRFDPQTGSVQATIAIAGADPAGILATPHGVWVACFGNGYVYRIDAGTNRVSAATEIGVAAAAQDLVFAEGLLWITDSAGEQVVVMQPGA